jgi:hypothetical protein
MRLFRRLAAHVPVVIITHDPAVAEACDRTIVLQSAVTAPGGARPATTPRKQPRRALWALGAGGTIVATVVAVLAATGVLASNPQPPGAPPAAHASTRPALAKLPTAPAPHLAAFVPASQRVLRVTRFNLTGGGAPVVAVTTTSQPTANTPTPAEDLLLLAWDNYARRWSVVYDAAKTPVNVTVEPDAAISSYQFSAVPSAQPLFPPKLGVTGIRLAKIYDQHHGADLMINAGIEYGDGLGQATEIIHYNGVTASVAWAFTGNGGTTTVTGKAPHQTVAITSAWYTPSDPHCCPSRNYRFVIAPASSQTGESYRVISDNRPWLGVFITFQSSPSGNSQAIVTSVISGSPAAGILEPGDILRAVAGPHIASHGLGPAVLDELGMHKAGNIVRLLVQRGGTLRYATVRLGTLADPRAVNAGNNLASAGNTPEYMI